MNLRRIVMTAAAFAVVPLTITAAVIPAQAQVEAPALGVTVNCQSVTSLMVIAVGMSCIAPGGVDVDAITPVTLVSAANGTSVTCQVATVEANGTVIGVGCGLPLPTLPLG